MRTVHSVFIVSCIALAAVSIAGQLLERFDVPADAEYRELYASMVADGFDLKQDALAVYPAWSLRASVDAPVRPISSDRLSVDALNRWRYVYLVVEPDPGSDFNRFQDKYGEGQAIISTERLRLLRYEPKVAPVVFDFRAGLPSARVVIEDPQGAELVACTRVLPRGHACPKRKAWQRVTRDIRNVTENGRDVIWAHAPVSQEVLVVRYDNIPAFDRLVLGFGFTRTAAENPAHSPVEFAVLVDGKEVFQVMAKRKFGFEEVAIPTTGSGTVSFRVTTPGKNARAHFTFDAFALGRGTNDAG